MGSGRSDGAGGAGLNGSVLKVHARTKAKSLQGNQGDSLRHTGAVLAAQTGATLAELMGRLGHTTPGAALRYQHAAHGRDAEIARRLSALYEERIRG